MNALAPQSNGRWIVAGDFYGSRYIARIDAEGNLDPLFLEPEGHDQVHSVAVQEDDKIIVGGIRWDSQGRPQGALTRLTADGAPDSNFDAGLVTYGVFGATIRSVVLQANGKVLVGGTFSEIQGEPRGGIARLHPDGTLDASFGQHLAGANNTVSTVVEQADGKILIGGQFTAVNQVGIEKLARLNPDGSLDETFGPVVFDAPGISAPYIRAIAVQNDGKIVIGGSFSAINGISRNNIARLHPDGSLDLTFADGLTGADQLINVIAVQQDRGILIGGAFRVINGASRSGIARLNPDGTLEPTFGLGMLGIESHSARRVSAIGQEDDKILIGGSFSRSPAVLRASTECHGEELLA